MLGGNSTWEFSNQFIAFIRILRPAHLPRTITMQEFEKDD